MSRPLIMLTLALLLSSTPLLGCWGTDAENQKKPPCKKLHERNRKCVKALVGALNARLDKSVPADVKKKLSAHLANEITKNDFISKCREVTGAKDDRARAKRKSLLKCHALADCTAYAACFLKIMDQVPKPPLSKPTKSPKPPK